MGATDCGMMVRVDRIAGDGTAEARAVVCGPLGVEVDITRAVVSGVAYSLWLSRGGDDLANWLDAERLVNQMLAERAGARASLSMDGEAGTDRMAAVVVPQRKRPVSRR